MSKSQRAVDNAVAGGMGGVAAVCVSYPFDLLKTRLQFEAGKGNRLSMGQMARIIFAEGKGPVGGVAGFYRGLDQLVPEAAFKVLMRFAVFKELQEQYKEHVLDGGPLTLGANLVCGATAGFLEAGVVVQPFERGKTLRADFHSPYKVWGAALKEGGPAAMIRSVYTGFWPCAGRQVGNQAASFSVFYGLKQKYLASTGEKDLGTVQRLGFGFLGGCSGACLTMPMDVAKTIAQKQQGAQTQGTVAIMADIVKRNGVRGLYAGLLPRLGRVGLDRAVGFYFFEVFESWIRGLRGYDDE